MDSTTAHADDELFETDNVLADLLDRLDEGVLIVDGEGLVRYLNLSAALMLTTDKDKLIGQPFAHTFSPGQLSELELVRPTGESLYIQMQVATIDWNDSGAYLVTLRDITDRKRSKEAEQESQRALASLIANLPGMAYRCLNDPDWTMQFVSGGSIPLLGYTPAELINNEVVSFGDLIHAEDADTVWHSVQTSLKEKRPFQLEYRVVTKDGHTKWVWEQGSGIFADTGELLAIEGFITDVNERRNVENALRTSQQRLTLALEGTELALWDYNVTRDELYVNDRWYSMLGYTPGEFEPSFENWKNLVHPEDRPRVLDAFEKHVHGKTALYEAEIRMKRKSGRWQWVVTWGKVVERLEDGAAHRITGTHRDISERKKMENALARERKSLEKKVEQRTAELQQSLQRVELANLQLQEVNRHKSKFLSAMSHELRTPLNGVLGFADLLMGQQFGALNEKQVRYVQRVQEAGNHLLALINDLLDMAKIDAGAVELEIETFPADECIHAVVDMMGTQFRKKDLSVSVNIDPDVPWMTGDRRKCKQILLNLLSNAAKYTPEGGQVDLTAELQYDNRLKIAVADTGVGIEPEHINEIFSEFQQADRTRDEALGGIGLGLALTRRLVELHGGEIGVHSSPGEGSTFWFVLPIAAAAGEETEPHSAPHVNASQQPKRRRILVAEDNPANAELVLDMLSIHEHIVSLAETGVEAVNMARQFKPELILMDMRMPGMDGLEATQRIRAIPEFADIPIIALTASTGYESAQRCIDAGCTAHLAKPVNVQALENALQEYLGNEQKPCKPSALQP